MPIDNLCENALDLSNDKLIVKSDLPFSIECQWLIATHEKHYVDLEFQNIDVRIAALNYFKIA